MPIRDLLLHFGSTHNIKKNHESEKSFELRKNPFLTQFFMNVFNYSYIVFLMWLLNPCKNGQNKHNCGPCGSIAHTVDWSVECG